MGFSFFVGETNEVRSTPKNAPMQRVCLGLCRQSYDRRFIGRQAPVKRCLARFAGLAPRVLRPNSEAESRIAPKFSAKI
jgi:hypothetical protein